MYYSPYTEFESPRCKSVSFHPTKSILLSSHHTSIIHAYDLHLNSLVHTFNGHDGPIRCVLFHPRSDNFISGGDDTKVILWSYSKKKILFTFKGHTDYVRSLDFHPTMPWILSSSDDQTIRIWNFQSYKLLTTVSGHTHYVMCAKFVGDSIVSCSLDQTIRTWDYTALTKKKETSILGMPSVVIKQIIDAHERGINWIEKCNEKNLMLTCGDDRQVKIWHYNGSLYEKDSLYNHQGNVSGGCFLKDIIISVGEDGVINIADKKITFDTRFWCAVSNRTGTLLAFGHDSGIKVYTTERKNVPYANDGNGIYYAIGKTLMYNNLKSEKNIMQLQNNPEAILCINEITKTNGSLKNCLYSGCVAVQYLSRYELIKDGAVKNRGTGQILLMAKNIITLRSNDIFIDDNLIYTGEGIRQIHYHSNKSFIIVKAKTVEIFDINSNKVTCSIVIHDIERIKIGSTLIALLSKRKITFIDTNYKVVGFVDEMIEITDGFFEESTFFYSTLRHIKYALNNSRGVLRSIEKTVFPVFIKDEYLFYMTKDGLENVKIDFTEYNMKKAVSIKDIDTVKSIISRDIIPIEIITDHLMAHNMNDLAIPYLKERTSEVLIDLGKLNDAYESVKSKREEHLYERLFEACMAAHEYDLAEKALIEMKDYSRLFMFYAIRKETMRILNFIDYCDAGLKMKIAVILNDSEMIKEILSGKNTTCGRNIKDKKHISKSEVDFKSKINYTEKKANQLQIEKDMKPQIETEQNNKYEKLESLKIKDVGDENKGVEYSPNQVIQNEAVHAEQNILHDSTEEILGSDDKTSEVHSKEEICKNDNSFGQNNESNGLRTRNDHLKVRNFNFKSQNCSEETADSKVYSDRRSTIDGNTSNENLNHSNSIQACQINDKFQSLKIGTDAGSDDTSFSFEEQPTLQDTLIDISKLKMDTVNFDDNLDFKFNEMLENITSGKFSTALLTCKEMLHFIAKTLDSRNECIEMRTKLGIYTSGLIIEKRKKKETSPERLLTLSSFFPSLDIIESHKILALCNFMIISYKNENFDTAKEIASKLKNCDGQLGKNARKILKSEKKGNKYVQKEGTFCVDIGEYSNTTKSCRFCMTKSFEGRICTCCEVGILE